MWIPRGHRRLIAVRYTLVRAQVLHLEVGSVCRHRQNTHRVGVAQAALPSLDGDDRRAGLDEVERERATKTEPDAVVDLHRNISIIAWK